MSYIKFEIKEDHLKLIKNLNFIQSNGIPQINTDELFYSPEIIEDAYLIIYGKKNNDVLDMQDFLKGSNTGIEPEKEIYLKQLISDLATVLDICCYIGEFKPGIYKRKSYLRHWIRE